MPRPAKVPSYKLHKPSGQARVIIDGKHIYLGAYGSSESREKYARFIAERYMASTGDAQDDVQAAGPGRYPDLSINELLLRYLRFAENYYTSDGKPTGEVDNMKDAMRALRGLFGHTRAGEFGPRSLKVVRQEMIEAANLSRGVVNRRIDRIKRIFKWAVSEELVSSGVYEALRAVAGLRYGRSNAREAEPVRPVAEIWVKKTLPFLPPLVADMVRVQLVSGIRSANLVSMRPCEFDRSGKVWIYEPADHKTRHLNKRLRIHIGPQGQAIIQRYLNRPPQAFLFSPREVQEWRQQQRAQRRKRKTPVYPSELKRLQREKAASRRRHQKREPGDRYDTSSYRRAIKYGIEKANKAGAEIPSWFPHQLRHNKASEIRKQYGIEGAQLALGHTKANISEVYAERDSDFAKRIARKTG